ncbi:MAG: PilZ domain-containing protein [Desulfobulbus sp.]
MEKKVSWDTIPSLEGLGVDWDYGTRNEQDRRAFIRLNLEEVGQLFEVREVKVKVATVQRVHSGTLLDISSGGAAVKLSVSLEIREPLKIGFILNAIRIVTKGQVRHVASIGGEYKIGVQFVDLEKVAQDFIGSLYASTVFRNAY